MLSTKATWRILPLVVISASILGGCGAKYTTPGASADFYAMGITKQQADDAAGFTISERLQRKPAAGFPTVIAVARLQGNGYSSYTGRSYGYGNFTLVTHRDVEKQEQFDRLAALPMVRGLAPLNRLVVTAEIREEQDLREAAASVQADMLLIYTFDTRFGVRTTVPFLGVITLGVFPNEEARVTSTASAALIDTRTGYVYGLAEATSQRQQLGNAWTSSDAVDDARLAAEREAFERLVTEVETMWRGVAQRFTGAVHANQ